MDREVIMEDEKKRNKMALRLPFGLCKRHGIMLPKNATPRQAWDALKRKTGQTPKDVFASLKAKFGKASLAPTKSEEDAPLQISATMNQKEKEAVFDKWISRYKLVLSFSGDKIFAHDAKRLNADNTSKHIQQNVKELKEYMNRLRDAEAQPSPSTIEGLDEIRKANEDLAKWRREFNRSFEGKYAAGGLGVRSKPQYNFEELYKKYPAAHAYLIAEGYENKSDYRMSAIGRAAKAEILANPSNHAQILEKMQKQLDEYRRSRIYD